MSAPYPGMPPPNSLGHQTVNRPQVPNGLPMNNQQRPNMNQARMPAMSQPPTYTPQPLTKPINNVASQPRLNAPPALNQIPFGAPTNLRQPTSMPNTQMNGHQPTNSPVKPGQVVPPASLPNGQMTQQPGLPRGRRPYPTMSAPATLPTTTQQPSGQRASTQPQTQTMTSQMDRMQLSGQTSPRQPPQTQTQPSRTNQYPQMPANSYNQSNTNDQNQLNKRLTVQQSQTFGLNLIEQRNIIPPQPISPPTPPISEELQRKNAKTKTMRCTFNAVPQTSNLLKQSKLPFGVYIQPFRDDPNIPIVSSVITRCRSCRSYLNPFVSLIDHRRWQCNMCFRINDIPEELTFDYNNRQYQDVRKRPELNHASIEFIAPAEYMLRPPQPSCFVIALDVSYNAIGTGYLRNVCKIIANNLDNLPGDSRTMIGFVTFNSSVQFYSLKANQSQPQMHVVSDVDDIYLPVPDGLLVNIKENKEMILQLLESLPTSFDKEIDTKCATGAAMLGAKKLVTSVGGRITVFQSCLPNVGPGKLTLRESSNISTNAKDIANLNPTTDFYKKLALECAGEQIAIDLFILAGQYCDLASMSGVSRYSSGAIHYYPDYHHTQNQPMVEKFTHDFARYLTRAIGLEAVMRLRCTKGMSINTFHGNFFVRSTDLLSLPNVNPDHSFGMQIDIEDNLTETSMVAFQAALLYTNTKGERRIRVHTIALPVTSKLSDIYAYADQEAIVNTLSKLAADRTLMSSLGDAREALMNACIDCLKSYKHEVANQKHNSALISPFQLRLLPVNILAMMKNEAFKLGSSVSLDQRVYSLLEFKWQPMDDALLRIYPRLYPIHELGEPHDESYAGPSILSASAERLSRQGIYLMDNGRQLLFFVGRNVSDEFIQQLFNIRTFNELPERMYQIPELNNDFNKETRKFLDKIRKDKTFHSPLQIIREDTKHRVTFLNNLIEDRTESSMSYHEFLQHVQRQINGS
ncbi:protein transport protein Sec24A-like isoform X1 [Clytia hemisphaerica]|uniref:Uncharacterized protein n=1 Tax=Clytia hemisphaerica TaxID=252671 RepID=A0A7M5VH69_9CNID